MHAFFSEVHKDWHTLPAWLAAGSRRLRLVNRTDAHDFIFFPSQVMVAEVVIVLVCVLLWK
jgi:hypothetical protein